MARIWRDHLEALSRFNAWEADRLRDQPADFASALAWLSEAWELAERYGRREDPTARRERHLEYLLQLKRSLERGRLRS